MARPQASDDWQQPRSAQRSDDWRALRADLVQLLRQVDGQAPAQRPAVAPQNAAYDAPVRQQAALQSVKRAVERYDNRLEEELQPVENDVAAAIAQIKSRRSNSSARAEVQNNGRPAPRTRQSSGQIDGLTTAVENISDRLGLMETKLRSGPHSDARLEDISGQLQLLVEVVESLASVVGESGQVKRLEAQVASIARLISDTPHNNITEFATRLSNLADSVELLTDLQMKSQEQATPDFQELSSAHSRDMASIETGVRNVYERIDAIERNLTLHPEDIERLFSEMATISADMATVSQAVQNGVPSAAPQGMLERIDALNARVGQIEDRGDDGAIEGLRSDLGALGNSVRGAVKGQLASLESKIDNLGKAGAGHLSVRGLEEQIQQLVTKVDQTGHQLNEISRLQNETIVASTPNFDALADMVAQRTSSAVLDARDTLSPPKFDDAGIDKLAERLASHSSQSDGIKKTDLEALEQRIARLVSETSNNASSAPLTGVHDGIKAIDRRLAQLEASLNGVDTNDFFAEPPASTKPKKTVTRSKPEVLATPPQSEKPAADDSMGHNPNEEAPLFDKGFVADSAPAAPQQAPIQKSNAAPAEKKHPEAEPQVQTTTAGSGGHDFNPAKVKRPAKPQSSFAQEARELFDREPNTNAPSPNRPGMVTGTSRNTFIEAARRAAQKHTVLLEEAEPQSFMARALSRFQKKDKGEAAPNVSVEPNFNESAEPVDKRAEAKAKKAARAQEKAEAQAVKKAAKAEKATKIQTGEQLPTGNASQAPQTDAPQESFLLRHRRPILLGATLVAVGILTVDLIVKRRDTPPPPVAQSVSVPANLSGALGAPRLAGDGVRNMLIDPQSTGSVDPFVRIAPMLPSTPQQLLPSTLGTASSMVPQATNQFETSSINASGGAVKLALPPKAIGPLQLREAAANGDARAQFEVAAIYSEGQALTKDLSAAATWFEHAAMSNFTPAAYRLGGLYESGQGVEKDLTKAIAWYKRAAEAGNRMSMHNLAALYAGGELGPQRFGEAATWFEQAANLGLADSQFNLGMLHARGLGVAQDMAASYKWFSLAAAAGDSDAAKARDDIASSLDTETVARVQAEISNWRRHQIDIGANFAPIGTWSDTFNPGPTIGDKSVVEKVQAVLNRLGYKVGIPDGLMGPRTRDAIRDFEREIGMSESGAINPRLLAVLGSQPV